MSSYDKTSLWQRALATQIDDPHASERERLRAAYDNVRKRAQPLAEAIAKDLPDFTVHDITHSDALWEYADLIAGSEYQVNPSEAFVLGCAFLFHDLGMGLVAYPGGISNLKQLDLWKDTIADLLRNQGVSEINDSAIKNADANLEKRALTEVLRRLHASKADTLAMTHWYIADGDQRFYLIDDPELRLAFGPTIGRVAFSHWWPIEQVAREFAVASGALAGFPPSWTVDPVKLACLLRCADYAHVDERRAPAFLRALRDPCDTSVDHWKFQAKLYQPRIDGDRLIYTAKSGFALGEATAWWHCFDTLHGIDSELRKVDSLLSDTRRERFAARGVSQAEEPARMARLIKTDGWMPIDTRIRVTAVANLVAKLGGQELYGDRVTPPLREMIQNAADAVRARRLIDGRDSDWGEVCVTTGKDELGRWLQVEDNGVGMSEAVLTGPLLDFGTSFWGSSLMHEQLPGLAAKGFRPTGRYGIGFFSVFMWGSRVDIVTRRFDKGRDETLVLSFRRGLEERPLLRTAQASERILDGGTRIRVWLKDEATFERLLDAYPEGKTITLAQVCGELAPALDVTLTASTTTNDLEVAIKANDWLFLSDEILIRRLIPRRLAREDGTDERRSHRPRLQIIKDATGRIFGRAALWRNDFRFDDEHESGAVTVGGLRACRLEGIIGILTGEPRRAARDSAIPEIPEQTLRDWASAECDIRLTEDHPVETLTSIAEVALALGIQPLKFPIAETDSGWVSLDEIVRMAESHEEAILVEDHTVQWHAGANRKIAIKRGVLVVSSRHPIVLQDMTMDWFEWPRSRDGEIWGKFKGESRTRFGAVIKALASGWGCSPKDLLPANWFDLRRQDECEIGSVDGTSVLVKGTIVRRPK